MDYYRMLENISVIIGTKKQFNFIESEIYTEGEFEEAGLQLVFLLKNELCKVLGDGEKHHSKKSSPAKTEGSGNPSKQPGINRNREITNPNRRPMRVEDMGFAILKENEKVIEYLDEMSKPWIFRKRKKPPID